jgi:hypothetical protein
MTTEADLGYVCGMLAAKGRINRKRDLYLSVETSDKELLEIALKKLSTLGQIRVNKRNRNGFESFLAVLRGNAVKVVISYDMNTGRHEWNVPSQAFTSKEFRINFIKAFFDFSGTIKARKRNNGQKERVMKVSSINQEGLKNIKSLLEIEGVKSIFYKSGKNFVLEINGKNNLEIFLEKIGLEKQSKKELIKKILNPTEFDKFLNSH